MKLAFTDTSRCFSPYFLLDIVRRELFASLYASLVKHLFHDIYLNI